MEYLWVDWGLFAALLGVGAGVAAGGIAAIVKVLPDLLGTINRIRQSWLPKEQSEKIRGANFY